MFRKMALLALACSLGVNACKKEEDDKDEVNFTLVGAGSSSNSLRIEGDGIDPNFMNIKIYKFAVSKNKDCSDPTTVYTNDNPEYENFLDSPTIGSGTIADGEYPCVIIEMSSKLQFSPKESSGACEKDKQADLFVCHGDSQLVDGTAVSCERGEEAIIALYLSTSSEFVNGGDGDDDEECQADESACTCFLPPVDGKTKRGFTLGKALVVSGATTGKFVVNGAGKITSEENDGEETCDMGPPVFSFE